ncbi:MBL fold metallo-hydrolase [candidate division KSB1 bacterium]|nr:MBL fold metallo-hydrolase [candidate division KSB1 bacterium]
MKVVKIISIILVLMAIFSLTPLVAEEAAKIQLQRYSDRVLVLRTGTVLFDQVIAIKSAQGLVIIDTGESPAMARRYRAIIEEEFGRKDFVYVINTHFHFEHIGGNQVFSEATIISHDRAPENMRQFRDGKENFLRQRQQTLTFFENQLKNLDPASRQAQQTADFQTMFQASVDAVQSDFVLTLPNVTFNDRLTLDLGDLKLRLFYFGPGRHSNDDIMIYCPEEKLLMTESLFNANSMQLVNSPQFNAPQWIDVLNEVLQPDHKIELVLDTHNGGLTPDFMYLWRDYFVDLWQNMQQAKEKGLTFAQVQDELAYAKKFTYIEKSGLDPLQLQQQHANSLRLMWYNLNNTQSAANILRDVINQDGIAAAQKSYKTMLPARDEKFYFNENEFNNLGYALIQDQKIKAAIEIFELNVALFPDSWNAYDSLGEAYMNDGQNELAIKNYKKSVELNPRNANGIAFLKRLEGAK